MPGGEKGGTFLIAGHSTTRKTLMIAPLLAQRANHHWTLRGENISDFWRKSWPETAPASSQPGFFEEEEREALLTGSSTYAELARASGLQAPPKNT